MSIARNCRMANIMGGCGTMSWFVGRLMGIVRNFGMANIVEGCSTTNRRLLDKFLGIEMYDWVTSIMEISLTMERRFVGRPMRVKAKTGVSLFKTRKRNSRL